MFALHWLTRRLQRWGSLLPMNPHGSFKFRLKISGMRAQCMRTHFCDWSGPCFITCEHTRLIQLLTCKHHIVTYLERARYIVQCSSGKRSTYWCGEAANVRSGQVRSSVQNGEHSFCSSSRFHFNIFGCKSKSNETWGIFMALWRGEEGRRPLFSACKTIDEFRMQSRRFFSSLSIDLEGEGSRKLQEVKCIRRTILKSTDKL